MAASEQRASDGARQSVWWALCIPACCDRDNRKCGSKQRVAVTEGAPMVVLHGSSQTTDLFRGPSASMFAKFRKRYDYVVAPSWVAGYTSEGSFAQNEPYEGSASETCVNRANFVEPPNEHLTGHRNRHRSNFIGTWTAAWICIVPSRRVAFEIHVVPSETLVSRSTVVEFSLSNGGASVFGPAPPRVCYVAPGIYVRLCHGYARPGPL